MTTRLTKEARELLPALLGTLVLMAAPALFYERGGITRSSITLLLFGLGCAVMGGLVFGSELQHRTLGLLLAQPVRRSVLWWEKMGILGAGLVVTFWAGGLLLELSKPRSVSEDHLLLGLALVPLCAFCGAPYLTLRTRSGIGGTVFAVVLPGGLVGFVAAALDHWLPQVNPKPLVLASLLVYCALVYWRGYRCFLNLELKEGGATDMALPAGLERLLTRGLGWVVPGVTGPGMALLKKEVRLHTTSFLLAGIFSVLVILSMVVRWRDQGWGNAMLAIEYAIYMVIVPFIIGAMAVAEERTMGVAEWQLTLPVSAGKQWLTKMLVVLPTSTVLGLLLPGGLFVAGVMLFNWAGGTVEFPSVPDAVLILLLQALATTVAVYTASACGNTMRAILLAFSIVVAAAIGFGFVFNHTLQWGIERGLNLNNSALRYALWCAGAVVMWGLLQALAFRNFRRRGVSERGLVVQLAGLLLGWTGLVLLSLVALLLASRFG